MVNLSGKVKMKRMIPPKEEFIKGIEEFGRHEKRDAMYKIAILLVCRFWGNPAEMADGLGVLLLTWNQALYRYGSFDFDRLEECIRRNFQALSGFRKRNIVSLSEADEKSIQVLFNDFLEALQVASGKKQGVKSPVAVAKALHLLAPKFFPLWDAKIAKAYNCCYNRNPFKKYNQFMKLMKNFAKVVGSYVNLSYYPKKSLLKLIDEYNYSKYTKEWI